LGVLARPAPALVVHHHMLNALGLARQLDEVDSAALSVLVCVLQLMIATRKKETDEKIHRVSACAFGTANAIISLHRLDRVPGKVDPLFTAEQMQQHEHPFARLQEREQPDLIDQRTVDHPHTRTRR